jgi:hypothetical protein
MNSPRMPRHDSHSMVAAILVLAVVSPAIAQEEAKPARGVPQPVVGEGVLKQAVEGGVRVLLGVQADAAAAAQMKQQRVQQARQMEQMLQPGMHGQLEFIRSTCGDLSPQAKQAIRNAAAEAVRVAAEQFAAQQMRPGRRSIDLDTVFSEKLDPVIERNISPDAVATWRAERDARRQRRAETARILIVAKLDEGLDLTTAQREVILADLESRWDAAWLCELLDSGVVVNGRRLAPDFAAECIVPHLDERQRKAWEAWVQAAGSRQAGVHLGWRFPDGPGLRGADPWWNP